MLSELWLPWLILCGCRSNRLCMMRHAVWISMGESSNRKIGTNLTKRKDALERRICDFPLLSIVCKDATAPAFHSFLIFFKKLIPFCVMEIVYPHLLWPGIVTWRHLLIRLSSQFKINSDIHWHGKPLFSSRGALTVWLSLLLKLGSAWVRSCILRTLKLLQREQNHSNAEDARFFGEATGSGLKSSRMMMGLHDVTWRKPKKDNLHVY